MMCLLTKKIIFILHRYIKRDDIPAGNTNLSINISQLFKYKAVLVGKTENIAADGKNFAKNKKIVVPLKYLSNFGDR